MLDDAGTIRTEKHSYPRHVSVPLMLGLLTLPLLFGWFLARRGYPNSTRIAVAIYAVLTPALAALGRLG